MWPLNQQAIISGSHAFMCNNALQELESHLLSSEDGSWRGLLHEM